MSKGYLKSPRFRCDPGCMTEPYYTINGNRSGVPVTEFLENMDENFDPRMKHAYRVHNYQGIGSNISSFFLSNSTTIFRIKDSTATNVCTTIPLKCLVKDSLNQKSL